MCIRDRDKEFRWIAQPRLGHTWSDRLADHAVAFINQYSGKPVPHFGCEGLEDGLYCGNDAVNGYPNMLYRCSAGTIGVAHVCTAGCQVNSADVDDNCK